MFDKLSFDRMVFALIILFAVTANDRAGAAETRGAGSTFVEPILAKWAEAYRAKTGNIIAYQPVGSGLGIARIKAAKADFGATDRPLRPEELATSGLVQFPLVVGGVVPVFNLAGVKSGDIRFSGKLLADIFLGKIRRWDDPAIRELNPDVKIPNIPITVVHRTDESGTTFNWVNYLSKVSPEWKTKVGEGTIVDWPLGIGGKGNDGVAALVEQSNGALGYVEYSYVLRSNFKKLAYGRVQNKAGNFVEPAAQSFLAAASTAEWSPTNEFYLIMTDAAGEKAYPITATVFVLLPRKPKRPDATARALGFFRWALDHGQPQAEAMNYVPLPPGLVDQIKTYWKSQFQELSGL